MIRVIALLMTVLLCIAHPAYGAQQSRENANNAKAGARVQRGNSESGDLKADLERMRALLGQMQRNVAFVSSGDTPLKHQFEVEIEMWQILIRDMDEKVSAQEAH